VGVFVEGCCVLCGGVCGGVLRVYVEGCVWVMCVRVWVCLWRGVVCCVGGWVEGCWVYIGCVCVWVVWVCVWVCLWRGAVCCVEGCMEDV